MSLARWPPRFAYQVWLWTTSAPSRAGRHREVDRHRPQRGEVRRLAAERVPRRGRRATGGRAPRPVGAPAVDVDVDELRELAREVLDVHAGAAVDVRRVLAREEGDPHVRPRRRSPLPITTTPPAETTNRLRSLLGVDPDLRALARCATFLSTIACCTTARAADVDAVHERPSPRPGRSECDAHAGRQHRAPHGPARDDDAGADHRVERRARAGPARRTRTSPAAAARAA